MKQRESTLAWTGETNCVPSSLSLAEVSVLEFYIVNFAFLMCSLCLDSLRRLSQLSAGVCTFQYKIKKGAAATEAPPEAPLAIIKHM